MSPNGTQRCRTCLSKSKDMVSINSNHEINGEIMKLSELIMICSPIQITSEDNFPKYICVNCIKSAEQSYCFRVLCETSEKTLKEEAVILEKVAKEEVYYIVEDEILEDAPVGDLKNEITIEENCYDDDFGENIEILEEEFNMSVEDDGFSKEENKNQKTENDISEILKESSDDVVIIESDYHENKCPICNFDYPTTKALTRHIATHKVVPTFYKCHLCPRQFLSTEVLEKHLKLHKNESPVEKLKKFKCLSCVARFFTPLELRTHVNLVHRQKTEGSTKDKSIIKCFVCNQDFDDMKLAQEHIKGHKNSEKGKHTCYICSAVFSDHENLQKHVKKHSVNDKEVKRTENYSTKIIYACKLCDFEAKTLNSAKQHLSKTHVLRVNQIFANLKYKCAECAKSFEKIYEIFKHNDEHVEIPGDRITYPKDFVCEICQRPCKTLTRYKDHIKSHQKKWPRKCLRCNDIIEKRGDYNLHMNQKHENLKEFCCNQCGKRFFHQKNLTAHMGIHTGERKFMCDICGWKFQAQNNLISHLKIHSDRKTYKCPYCPKVFAQSVGLRSHMINHVGERKYECDICNKKFLRVGARNNHRKIHTGQKDYACPLCDKKFTASSTRNKHLLTHTGEKNWICEFCNKAFSRKSNLTVHRKIHTGETPHVCEICGKGFIQRHVLRSHLMMHRKKGHNKSDNLENIEEDGEMEQEELEETNEETLEEDGEISQGVEEDDLDSTNIDDKYLVPSTTVDSIFLDSS